MTEIALKPKEWLENPDHIVAELTALKEGDVTINADGCDFLGAQAAQIVLVAQKAAEERGASFHFNGASAALENELHLLGLEDILSKGAS